MKILSKIPILFPLKEPEVPVHATAVDGIILNVEVFVEGSLLSFNRDAGGYFRNYTQSCLEPAYIAYIERQLNRRFN